MPVPTVLAAVYAGMAAAVVAAWLVAGETWWGQLVHLTTVWWTLPAVPLLLLALGYRRWLPAALLGVPVVVLVWAYGGLLVGSAPAAEPDLRVASYNTWFRLPDASGVTDLVAAEDPDVLLLQEVGPGRAGELRQRLGDELPHAWFGEADFAGGVGVMSRFEIAEVRPVAAAVPFEHPTAVVELELPGGNRLQVVPAHLVPACPVCGPFVERQRREVESRRRETTAILRALDPDVPAVVGGDLNGGRRSGPYRRLAAAGFRDPHWEVGSGLGLTYPAEHAGPSGDRGARGGPGAGAGAPGPASLAHLPVISFPVLRLDWVLVRGLVPVAARVGDSHGSDHRPVVVDVAVPGRS